VHAGPDLGKKSESRSATHCCFFEGCTTIYLKTCPSLGGGGIREKDINGRKKKERNVKGKTEIKWVR
jgi:hypothetical protein